MKTFALLLLSLLLVTQWVQGSIAVQEGDMEVNVEPTEEEELVDVVEGFQGEEEEWDQEEDVEYEEDEQDYAEDDEVEETEEDEPAEGK